MPKANKDYSKTIIYRIRVGDKNYYGHTTQPLHKRKWGHKSSFKDRPNQKLYKAMRDVGMNVDDIELTWVEDWSCDNVNQARARERYWVERDGMLNRNVPSRSPIEYRREKYANDAEWRNKHIEQSSKIRRDKYENDKEWKKSFIKKQIDYVSKKRVDNSEWREKVNEKNKERMKKRYENDEEFRNRLKEYNRERVRCDICGKKLSRNSITYHRKNVCKNTIPL
jgi:hypothetical protein